MFCVFFLCRYTDAIDRPGLQSNKRVHAQILKICAFLSGLTGTVLCCVRASVRVVFIFCFGCAVSVDFEVGQEVVEKRRWKEHEGFFRTVLEVGRRHKVLNPDRMRK